MIKIGQRYKIFGEVICEVIKDPFITWSGVTARVRVIETLKSTSRHVGYEFTARGDELDEKNLIL